jgi:hypothetical protein
LSRCQEQLAAFREVGVQYPIAAPQAVHEEHATAVQRFLETFEPG